MPLKDSPSLSSVEGEATEGLRRQLLCNNLWIETLFKSKEGACSNCGFDEVNVP